MIDHVRANAHNGDVVALHPPGTLIPWYFYASRDDSRPVGLDLPRTYAVKLGDKPFSGRVWLVDETYAGSLLKTSLPECAPRRSFYGGDLIVRCLRFDPSTEFGPSKVIPHE
jgi:hypothetical protein